MATQTLLFDDVGAFRRFHEENPQVWRLFRRFALEAAQTGRTRFGAKMVWERMRWYTNVETNDQSVKLNSNWAAHYARLFVDTHPQHRELFELRRIRTPR